jgi:tetratricopeptide (TPR) repeat protein
MTQRQRTSGGIAAWALVLGAGLCTVTASTADARSRHKDKQEAPAEAAPTSQPAAPAATTPAPTAPASPTPAPASAAADQRATQDPCLSDPKCNELYEKARTLSRANQYEAALIMYQQTYAMTPLPWLLLNIGRVQQKLGRNEQAAGSYRKILEFNAKMPTDETAGLADVEVTAKAREYLKQAEDAIAEQKRANPGVVVTTAPVVDKVPLYKRWWFWTAIGGGVGLVAVGVGLGIGLSSSNSGARVANGVDIFYPTF